MSNKDVRKPAPGAGDDFWARQKDRVSEFLSEPDDGKTPNQAKPDPDEELLASITPERREEWAKTGWEAERRLVRQFNAGEGGIDDDEALSALDVCTRFLKQLVSLVSAVMETVDVKSMRAIVAGETNLPRGMVLSLKAAGIEVGDDAKKTQSSDNGPAHQDWRKRPRGARHPLMVLLTLAAQAARLLQKITAGTNPDAQNLKRRAGDDLGIPDLPGA